MGKQFFDKVDYIVLDCDTFIQEKQPIEDIEPYQKKILFIGECCIEGFNSISKDEFYIENINLYFNNSNYEKNEEETSDPTNDVITHLADLYLNPNVSMDMVQAELKNIPYEVRIRFYDLIDNMGINKVKSLNITNPLKKEYLIYKIKKMMKFR